MSRLVWFRNDLRVKNNKALFYACEDTNTKVFSIFISTPIQWIKYNLSDRQIIFIYDNLLKLREALYKLGIPLFFYNGRDFISSLNILKIFCEKNKINEIFYNKQYELDERKRDKKLKIFLSDNVKIYNFDDNVFFPPGSILNYKNEMYKVFTPFRKQCIKKLIENDICSLPLPKKRKNIGLYNSPIPLYFNFVNKKIKNNLLIGEENALNKLKYFFKKKITSYLVNRNIPSIQGTSFLSPYLTIGVISPIQCFSILKNNFFYKNLLKLDNKNSLFAWINELIWREFYRHLIFYYPFLCKNEPFIYWTNNIKWNNNDYMFNCWKKGITGFPIVDAGMKQLNKIGWMHNRLRMITSSFLVKNLLIDWRKGQEYFMSKLLDGDFSSNNGGWQWVSSTGTDSVPYFRIFNPLLQSKRFDEKGAFIRYWLPELKNVPDKYIHQPHIWAVKYRYYLNYPLPIINYDESRKLTLSIFKKAKNFFYKKKF